MQAFKTRPTGVHSGRRPIQLVLWCCWVVFVLPAGTSQSGADLVRAADERSAVSAKAAAGEEIRREQAVLLGDPVHACQRRHRCTEETGHVAGYVCRSLLCLRMYALPFLALFVSASLLCGSG